MQDRQNAVYFVHQHVKEFTERFEAKLREISPVICEETVMRNSGIKGLAKAMDHLQALNEQVADAIAERDAAANELEAQYGEAVDELMEKEVAAATEEFNKKLHDFKYRLHTAIGQVELVSTEAAYETLEACRREVEDMGE